MAEEKAKRLPLKQYAKNAYKYRYLMQEIVRKNVKLQYRNSFLGIFWTMLQPFLTMLVLVFIFTKIFGKANDGVVCYPVYLLTGRLLYEFYTQATNRAMRSIRNSASVLKKVYVPKYIYPIANVFSTFITFLISLLVLVLVMGYFLIKNQFTMQYPDLHLSWYILLAFVPIILLCVFSTGVGLILSVLNVYFKDIEYIYSVITLMLFYVTPIMYSLKTLARSGVNSIVMRILMLNPLYSILEMFRSCVLYCSMWNWNHFLYAFGISLFSLAVGLFVFYKHQDRFILYI